MELLTHYNKEIVKKEIFEFSKERWIALYGKTMIRYSGEEPLKFSSADDVPLLVKKYNARTVYATAGKYDKVNKENVEKDKIIAYTPFFDIDTKIDKWEYAIKAADVIISALDKEGVSMSVYLLWSGEGIHVRINENAIPKDYDPLTASHAIVQYILRKVKDNIKKLSDESGGVLKIDELIDSKRIFTAPLSFHKELDYVAVCFSPDKLHEFSLDWAKPESFVHEEGMYSRYVEDEAEELLSKAILEYKPAHEGIKPERKRTPQGKIGRFQVMGIVQAARYYVLYGDLPKAESFGLNRAIFYAWAKYYGKGYTPKVSGQKLPTEFRKDRILVTVAGEQVYQNQENGLFVIGDKEQTPQDYNEEIKEKINTIIPYEKAWEETVKYVSSFPKEVLQNQREFYQKVYLPIRDAFLEKVVNKKSGLDAFFK
ncbi:hypothetical protein [Acidianus sp. HS-5]|uniref:hypothetical protein n=1 Tax=Acidianus sp. HS-5 TaxID=2886040 RepID=UPI001F40D6B6|nr:hypothetical protein [Acidianus sp. HS-5]BDC17905.1 hypothetical protein HS5_07950 [Acidianus sp. HS-5]